jgi:hypothetical protein
LEVPALLIFAEDEDDVIALLRKPWWVGPVVAGLSVGQPSGNKPAEQTDASGYEIVNNRGILPRNGRIVVIATCPAGKRVINGGYVLPSVVDTTDFSRPEGNNAWRVRFRSNGGSGNASVYAICVTAN